MSSMSVRHSKVFSLALLAIGRHAKTERKKKNPVSSTYSGTPAGMQSYTHTHTLTEPNTVIQLSTALSPEQEADVMQMHVIYFRGTSD